MKNNLKQGVNETYMKTVLLIGEDGSKIGNVTFNEANRIAKDKGLDLIAVNRDKQVFKLGDRGKLNYDRKQREKQRKVQKKTQKIKEIQIRPTTDVGDIEIKTRKIKGFLEEGLRTRLVMKFKRSQLGYKAVGLQKVNELIQGLIDEGLASADSPPKFEGNNISVFINPTGK